MLYTFMFTGSHTIGNLIVTEAMTDEHRAPSDLLAYRVPHSLNDQVHITTEAATEAEGRALLRRACERLITKFATIMTTAAPLCAAARATSSATSAAASTGVTVRVRVGTILHDSDIK